MRLQSLRDNAGCTLVGIGAGIVATNTPPPLAALVLRSIIPQWFLKRIDGQLVIEREGDKPRNDPTHVDLPLRWAAMLLILLVLSCGAWKLLKMRPLPIIVQCHPEGVPVAEYTTIPTAPLVDPAWPVIGNWYVATAKGVPFGYEQGDVGRMIYRCEVTNITRIHLTDVSVDGKIFLIGPRGAPSRGSVLCDGNSVKKTKDVKVSLGNIADGQSRVFYFYNGTTDCADFGLTAASSPDVRLRLLLDQPTQFMSLTPRHFR
jgi:hypothetical protein